MEEIKHRVNLVQTIQVGSITTGHSAFDIELVFIQFRKCLELIAFASLIANKALYSAAYEEFASHWHAKRMLEALEKINPDFFPVPVQPAVQMRNGVKHLTIRVDGFLTKDEFVSLYGKCGKILHARNPFTDEDPIIQIGYSVKEWVSRIQALLGFHYVHLVGGDKWIVRIPQEGKVEASSASPVDQEPGMSPIGG
jgi:hypothetical protein